jgi:tRNA nucleotidyltransferase (CCA-adding enzyme)
MMAATKQKRVKQGISDFITRLRNTRTEVTGKDLKGFGIEPGPIYREILDAVLEAKLNGMLKTAEDEYAYARERMRGAREAENGKSQ